MDTCMLLVAFLPGSVVSGVFVRYFSIPESRVENGALIAVYETNNAVECCLLCEKYPNCKAVNTYIAYKKCYLLDIGTDLFEATPTEGWTCYFQSLKDTKPTVNAIATQNSDFNSVGIAHKAIDGDTNGLFESGSCSHTLGVGTEKWWVVQFQTRYPVTAVVIWNRISHSTSAGTDEPAPTGAVSSGSTLFAKTTIVVLGALRVNNMSKGDKPMRFCYKDASIRGLDDDDKE